MTPVDLFRHVVAHIAAYLPVLPHTFYGIANVPRHQFAMLPGTTRREATETFRERVRAALESYDGPVDPEPFHHEYKHDSHTIETMPQHGGPWIKGEIARGMDNLSVLSWEQYQVEHGGDADDDSDVDACGLDGNCWRREARGRRASCRCRG